MKDTYEAEIYGFVCKETELVKLIVGFYRFQADYHKQVGLIIESSLPTLTSTLGEYSSIKLIQFYICIFFV